MSDSSNYKFQKKNPKATIFTKLGNIELRFFPDAAPRHIENFINLIKIKFYDGTTFHRVIPGFLIQGGDPLSKNVNRNLHGLGNNVGIHNDLAVCVSGGPSTGLNQRSG